jgi:hypothetical protein
MLKSDCGQIKKSLKLSSVRKSDEEKKRICNRVAPWNVSGERR